MPTYLYRCDDHGPFETVHPMRDAARAWPCPDCGTGSVRIWTVPRLALASRSRMAVLDHAERSRTEPVVVSSVPGRSRHRMPTAPANPAFQRLPRP
ncbi:MAG: FmdB family zinc ribbon protein [Pseudonocardia sp.]